MIHGTFEGKDTFSSARSWPLPFQEFYCRYLEHSDSESFERFYRSTRALFYSYAAEKCAVAGGDVDPQEVVNHLYSTLVIYAAMHRRVPVRALLSWCLGTIANLVHTEKRNNIRSELPLSGSPHRPVPSDPLDALIEEEEQGSRRSLYERILDLIHRPNRILSSRERQVLRLFYCEGKSMRSVAAACRIKPDYVAVLLHRARRKIAARFTKDGKQKERPVRTRAASTPGSRCETPPVLSPVSGP